MADWNAAEDENQRFRLLVESITDYAVCMLDAEGYVTTWNKGAARITGYSTPEALGAHFSQFYPSEDRAARIPENALEVAMATGQFEGEGWRIRKNGERFWSHVIIDAIRADDGQLLGFAKVTRDLSEQRRAAAALSDSDEQFRRLVLNVTDYAIYMLSPDGFVSSWNLGAERIKGYSSTEIIGEHFSRFYPEEERAKGTPQKGLDIARTTGHFQAEGWRLRKDGSRFWASVVIDAIHNECGELVGFAKITRDVTERVEQQKNLDRAREELFQAQKVEAIGQLTGGVAHDFNNLLMVVLGSLDVLSRRADLNERDRRMLENAQQAAERGAQLTKRMLAFARKQELEQKPVDIPELVRGMSDLLSRTLGPAIAIETRFPLSLPRVLADPNQLDSALLNLAVNARDAMPNGGNLVISAQERLIVVPQGSLTPGRYIALAVQDTGEGMNEETLQRAADPFFTTKGVGKGTGLGLSMVQGIAEQSGGQLILTSTPGKGTTAEIWLPVLEERDVPAPTPVAVPQDVPPPEQQLKVLAVDDDALVLLNTTIMIEELGHVALEAHSGDAALRIVMDNEDIDLVITDQAMPRMTGLALAAEISRLRPNLPVVLASGYADIEEARQLKLPRLPKPFGQNDLARIISRLVPGTATA